MYIDKYKNKYGYCKKEKKFGYDTAEAFLCGELIFDYAYSKIRAGDAKGLEYAHSILKLIDAIVKTEHEKEEVFNLVKFFNSEEEQWAILFSFEKRKLIRRRGYVTWFSLPALHLTRHGKGILSDLNELYPEEDQIVLDFKDIRKLRF